MACDGEEIMWEPSVSDEIFDILDPYEFFRVMPVKKSMETSIDQLQIEIFHCVMDFTVDEPIEMNLYDILVSRGLAERDADDYAIVERSLRCQLPAKKLIPIASSLDSDDSVEDDNDDSDWDGDPEYVSPYKQPDTGFSCDETDGFDIQFTDNECKNLVSLICYLFSIFIFEQNESVISTH